MTSDTHIVSIEWAVLDGWRPRVAGSNARLGAHGRAVRVPLVRVTSDDGHDGFGFGRPTRAQAQALLGAPLAALFTAQGVTEVGRPCELALWDLVGKRSGLPVYALAAAITGAEVARPYRVPCYDTSLYFDDLHLPTDAEAALLMTAEAREGYERGHRAFKIKVGRGARHMQAEEGVRRDIAVVHAVHEAMGSAATLMLDANDGYTLNLVKHVLAETAECSIFWLEEPFHEDAVLYEALRHWLEQRGLAVLLADGEGEASAFLPDWARRHLIDVVQYDIFDHGFTRWLTTGQQLDGWNVRSAPHHYGALYGNYAACHLAGAIRGFTFVEWDEARAPGLSAPGYTIADGWVSVPETPGFGLVLDGDRFRYAMETGGGRALL